MRDVWNFRACACMRYVNKTSGASVHALLLEAHSQQRQLPQYELCGCCHEAWSFSTGLTLLYPELPNMNSKHLHAL